MKLKKILLFLYISINEAEIFNYFMMMMMMKPALRLVSSIRTRFIPPLQSNPEIDADADFFFHFFNFNKLYLIIFF